MNKKFFLFYTLAIFILLVVIVFFLPDDFFRIGMKDEEIFGDFGGEVLEKREFVDYEKQIDTLINGNFDFEYVILDSMRSRTYSFKCIGTKHGEEESGTCTGTRNFSYTREDKAENFVIDVDYLDVQKIFGILREYDPKETAYSEEREFKYEIEILDKLTNDKIMTEVLVYTSIDNVKRIEISNAYMSYILKYELVL